MNNKGLAVFVGLLFVANILFLFSAMQNDPSTPDPSRPDATTNSANSYKTYAVLGNVSNVGGTPGGYTEVKFALPGGSTVDHYVLVFTLFRDVKLYAISTRAYSDGKYYLIDLGGVTQFSANRSYTYNIASTYYYEAGVTLRFVTTSSDVPWFKMLTLTVVYNDNWTPVHRYPVVSWLPLAALGLVAVIIGGLVVWKSMRH